MGRRRRRIVFTTRRSSTGTALNKSAASKPKIAATSPKPTTSNEDASSIAAKKQPKTDKSKSQDISTYLTTKKPRKSVTEKEAASASKPKAKEDARKSGSPSKVSSAKKRPSSDSANINRKARKFTHERAQEKSTPEKHKKTKIAAESTPAKDGGQKSKRKPKESKEDTPKHIRDVHITRKSYQKWQPLTADTKQDVVQVIDSVLPLVVSGVSGDEEVTKQVQKDLSELRTRILSRLNKIKAPKGEKQPSKEVMRTLQESLIRANNEDEFLQSKIQEEERLLDQEEEELEEYTNKQEILEEQIRQMDAQLHPFLKNLPEKSLNLCGSYQYEFTVEDLDIAAENTQLVQSLTQLCDQASTVGLQRWSERVSAVQDQLIRKRKQ